jgi:hypothetical protein
VETFLTPPTLRTILTATAQEDTMDLSPEVRAVVGRFARVNPWIGFEELAQEAAIALLTASKVWRERQPTLVVRRRLWLHVLERKSPVAARGGKHQTPTGAVACGLEERHHPISDGIEWRLDLEMAASAVRELLERHSVAACRVLLHEEEPAVVAMEMGVPVREVYQQTREAKKALLASRRLRRLAEELYA